MEVGVAEHCGMLSECSVTELPKRLIGAAHCWNCTDDLFFCLFVYVPELNYLKDRARTQMKGNADQHQRFDSCPLNLPTNCP